MKLPRLLLYFGPFGLFFNRLGFIAGFVSFMKFTERWLIEFRHAFKYDLVTVVIHLLFLIEWPNGVVSFLYIFLGHSKISI